MPRYEDIAVWDPRRRKAIDELDEQLAELVAQQKTLEDDLTGFIVEWGNSDEISHIKKYGDLITETERELDIAILEIRRLEDELDRIYTCPDCLYEENDYD